MKFMLIVHHAENEFEKLSDGTKRAMLAESIQLTHRLHGRGQYVHASPLEPTSTATVVRVREGRALVTDGPFIETREQIAGYFLIEAKDQDEAVAIAKQVPGARLGSVEVRPLRKITGLP